MGETDVVLGGSTNSVTGDRSGLHLLDGDISGGLSHKSTLLVGDNGVVGPDTSLEEGDGSRGRVGDSAGSSKFIVKIRFPCGEELGGSSHSEVDSHVVVRKSSGRKGDSRLPREEERKRKHQLVGNTGVQTMEEDGILTIGGEGLDSGTDHGIVTSLLGSRDREGGPEIELRGLNLHGDEVVEGDGDLLDEIVHEVLNPEILVSGGKGIAGGGGSDDGGGDLQPSL